MGKIKKCEKWFFAGQRWLNSLNGRLIEIKHVVKNAAVCVVLESPGNPREEGCLTHIFFPEFTTLLLRGDSNVLDVE